MKTCRIINLMDGGTCVTDNEDNKDVWCHWDQNISDALKWCGENGYSPTEMHYMDVVDFDPETNVITLDYSTYDHRR
jgi:hypothetical protein